MPRCNLTLKQKCQIIELSSELSTDQLAKKFRVHPTTVTRTLKKKDKIFDYSSRVNVNYKTVQTNRKGSEHDALILNYIKEKQVANEAITIKDICDKAVEFANLLNRDMKSRRAWWRRFKVRCNIIKSRLQKNSITLSESTGRKLIKQRIDKKSETPAKKKRYTFKVKANQLTTGPSNELKRGNQEVSVDVSPTDNHDGRIETQNK